jgi:radical SAM protein with 4Fe4S-binding SPASM domain
MTTEREEPYFDINRDVFLIKGAKRGALYNLSNGEIYSVDAAAVRIIEGCEAHRSIEDISSGTDEVDRLQIVGYLKRLAEAGLGTFVTKPSGEPKSNISRRYEHLDFTWFELREDCNLKCVHCYCMSAPDKPAPNRLTHAEWLGLIDDIRSLGCKALQFIGGEPFLYGDTIFELAEHAKEVGISHQEIFSNFTLLTDEWADRMADLGIVAATSIYSKRPEVHDLITTVPGSFERTMRGFDMLKERGIRVRVACTIMKHNQDTIDETSEFFREIGAQRRRRFDMVRPSGRGNDEEIYPDKLSRRRAYRKTGNFKAIGRETFIKRYNGNGCWQGKVAISSTGDVNPCIMQRDGTAENVRNKSLEEIIKSDIRRYWDISLDKIDICKDCEYRYACHDCRPVAIGQTGELKARSLHCSYDPYEGEWKDVEQSRESNDIE